MGEAALWGAAGASSLLLGALVALAVPIPRLVIGMILGFGAGTLISALTFELTEDAFELGGADAVAIGLAAGALAYFAGDWVIEGRGATDRMSSMGEQAGGSATALLFGAVLDGIPESAVIGITLLEGSTVGVAILAAVFISNMPEAISSSAGMRMAGHSTAHVLAVWSVVVVVSALSAAIAFSLADGASGNTIGLIQAFAGGAVLTMLADTMMPEAFRRGGNAVGLFTVLGFALAYLLSTLD
jgi:ZIP family zinc transporter